MKKSAVFLLILFMSIGTAFSQEKAEKKAEKTAEVKAPVETEKSIDGDHKYSEITNEDFETTPYSDKDISYAKTNEQQAGISIRDEFPAPIPNSKKYLGVKIYGKRGDTLTINFPRKLTIEKYCRSIAIWVYGKNFSGELSLFITDAEGKAVRLSFGKLNFLGWRKLTVRLTDRVTQQDKYLTKKLALTLNKLLYQPASAERLPLWNYFYVDDITAQVREKYTDRQSDEW